MEQKAEIFTKQGCPYCVKAKHLLGQNKISYVEYELGVNGISKETIEQKIGKGAVVKTVPQIFLNGEYVGGYTELAKQISGQ